MGAKTRIAWTEASWNPVTGCTEVSPGCDHCYARSVATRFAGGVAYPNGFEVTLRPDRLEVPLRWTKPRMIFVNSMSDLFHRDVPDEFIAQVFAVMALAPRHTFQVLTKRHGRMRALLSSQSFRQRVWDHMWSRQRAQVAAKPGPHPFPTELTWPLPNVWVGVSAEDQKWADLRVPVLALTPAAVRFVSAEPLLGPIALGPVWSQVDWLIAGGESGPAARRMDPAWVTDLVHQAPGYGLAMFVKQAGTVLAEDFGWAGKGEDPAEWPDLWAHARTMPRQAAGEEIR